MKKGFTLIEMLIVVVVLVTLMSITFKLGSINESSTRRTTTVNRMQRIENCLSGYYAAFGSYPPVKLHGMRNPYLEVSDHGIQRIDAQENKNIWNWEPEKFEKYIESDLKTNYQKEEAEAWLKVRAACMAQPFGCCCPYERDMNDYVRAQSERMAEEAQETAGLSQERKQILMTGFDDGVTSNRGRYQNKNSMDWREIQLFKFGVMSYLLPRLLVMTQSEKDMYRDFVQWTGNNTLPFDPIDGKRFTGWDDVITKAQSRTKSERLHVENIPSQTACARWLPNLEKTVNCIRPLTEYGVDLRNNDGDGFSIWSMDIYSPSGDGTSGPYYILDYYTVLDGWANDFYYYSPAPHQNYVLWSAGKNGRTFPPWISREELDTKGKRCVAVWTEDDIVGMSH